MVTVEEVSTECGHFCGALSGPSHALEFKAVASDVEVGALDRTAADAKPARAVGGVVHAREVIVQVADEQANELLRLRP